ncbi:MAG: DUF4349 domain-containing protein [Anaerolineales bacterium]
MKTHLALFASLTMIAVIVLTACGGSAAATPEPLVMEQRQPAALPPQPAPTLPVAPEAIQQDQAKTESSAGSIYEIAGESGESILLQNTNRKIIKNADMRLLVKDTDVAINRSTQIVTDLGGYIISSRTWYQDYYGSNLKYAALTIGVPVEQFERALQRFRDIAIRVLDENASGEDVTDQYVDLQSQLQNMEATRARIQGFLKDAKTVDEALRINQQLSEIEGEIEKIKGRMNYLADRSAYSTITVNLEPELPVLTPTPTPTLTPTATPRPWKPGETFNEARNTVVIAYQGIISLLIWLVVVFLPILLPPAFILWGLWKLLTRKGGRTGG